LQSAWDGLSSSRDVDMLDYFFRPSVRSTHKDTIPPLQNFENQSIFNENMEMTKGDVCRDTV